MRGIVIGMALALGACGGGKSESWIITRETDAMNDAIVGKAETKAIGENHDLEVAVHCNSNNKMNYVMTGKNKSDESADFRQTISDGNRYVTTGYRVDKKPAEISNLINPNSSNVTYLVGPASQAAASAQQLTIRMAFTDGLDTFLIDQTGKDFQEIVKPCLKKAATAQPTPVSTPTASAAAPTKADPIPLDAEMNREYAAQMQQKDWENRERELGEGELDPNGTMM